MEHNLWLRWLKLFGFFNGAQLLAEKRDDSWRSPAVAIVPNKVILTKVWDWKRGKCQYFKIGWYLYSLWHLRFRWPTKTQNIFLPSPRNFMFTRGGHFTLAKRKRSKKWKGEGSLDFLGFLEISTMKGWALSLTYWVWRIGNPTHLNLLTSAQNGLHRISEENLCKKYVLLTLTMPHYFPIWRFRKCNTFFLCEIESAYG